MSYQKLGNCRTLVTAHAAVGFLSLHHAGLRFQVWVNHEGIVPRYEPPTSYTVAVGGDCSESMMEQLRLAFGAYVAGRGES